MAKLCVKTEKQGGLSVSAVQGHGNEATAGSRASERSAVRFALGPTTISGTSAPLALVIAVLSTALVGFAADPPIQNPHPSLHDAPGRLATGVSAQHRRKWPRQAVQPVANAPFVPPPEPWVVEGSAPDSLFADAIAAAGDVNHDGYADVLVCEDRFANGSGRVAVYFGSSRGLAAQPSWSVLDPSVNPGSAFGFWAEGVGDLNADGYDDIVVLDSPAAPGNGSQANRAHVFFGSAAGLSPQAGWTLASDELEANLFVRAGRAGDVNGDGYDDLSIVARIELPGKRPGYRLAIFHGATNGLNHTAARSWDLDYPWGVSYPELSCAGDVNGDGFDDLICGLAQFDGPARSRSRVQVHLGSPHGVNAEPDWTATYPLSCRKGVDDPLDQHLGWSRNSAGDVNGDGFSDIIVGAPYADHDDINEGLAFVYQGSRIGLGREPQWFAESNQAFALLGWSVSAAGDVNGDGYDDVILGAPNATHDQHNEGAALVFLGSRHGLQRAPHWTAESDNSQQNFGKLVVGAGDVNGDGFADVLIAAPDYLRDAQKVGRVYLYYGSSQGLTDSSHWRIDKPWLAAIQQRADWTPPAVKWGGVGALLVTTMGMFVAWRRALARLRLVERETARTQERERLSRDLHDELGANLARLTLLGDQGEGGRGSPLSTAVQHTIQTAQQVVWAVNPANDTLEDLVAFLMQQAGRMFEGTGVRCLTEVPPMLPAVQLPAAVRKNVFLIAKEACTNILKHANATEARLHVTFDSGRLALVVEDNGQGLPAGPTRRFGNGLANMRRRAETIGADLQIGPRDGGGARVALHLVVPQR